MTYALTSFNTGQITLPKKWRDKVGTKTFMAEERDGWLFLRPIKAERDEPIYYENSEGFGIFAPAGINPDDIISRIKALNHG